MTGCGVTVSLKHASFKGEKLKHQWQACHDKSRLPLNQRYISISKWSALAYPSHGGLSFHKLQKKLSCSPRASQQGLEDLGLEAHQPVAAGRIVAKWRTRSTLLRKCPLSLDTTTIACGLPYDEAKPSRVNIAAGVPFALTTKTSDHTSHMYDDIELCCQGQIYYLLPTVLSYVAHMEQFLHDSAEQAQKKLCKGKPKQLTMMSIAIPTSTLSRSFSCC